LPGECGKWDTQGPIFHIHQAQPTPSGTGEFVPGLFQTPGYIRAVYLAAHPEASEAAAHRAVDLRQARQQRLQDRNITALIKEAAVRRVVGSKDAMRTQLEYLTNVIQREQATIQIVPFSAGAHAAMNGSFYLLKFPDGDDIDLVHVENERGGMYFERPDDLVRYTDVFTRTQQVALSPSDSAALLGSIIAED
jgi:hypothetical protein